MKPFSLIFRGMSLYFDLVVVTTTQKIFLLSRWREEMLLGKRKNTAFLSLGHPGMSILRLKQDQMLHSSPTQPGCGSPQLCSALHAQEQEDTL